MPSLVDQLATVQDDGSRRSATAGREWGFEPAPLLAAFQSKIGELESYRADLGLRMDKMTAAGKVAEQNYKLKLAELQGRLESELLGRVRKLDLQAVAFAESAAQIGDRLEKIDDAKQRARDTGELMEHLHELQEQRPRDFGERAAQCRQCFKERKKCKGGDFHTRWSGFFRGPPFNNDVHKTAKHVKRLQVILIVAPSLVCVLHVTAMRLTVITSVLILE